MSQKYRFSSICGPNPDSFGALFVILSSFKVICAKSKKNEKNVENSKKNGDRFSAYGLYYDRENDEK